MKTFLSVYSVLILMFILQKAVCQSPGYSIESFQSVYTEITEYESIVIQTENDLFWEVEFPFGFQFPFYDSSYNYVTFVHNAWGYFTDNEEFALYMLQYPLLVTEFNFDTSFIPSDVRYTHMISNNLQTLVLQFTKNRFFDDPYSDTCDTYMNWQVWLFENGVIEIHFGDMHMDNNPIYAPGKGFYDYTSDEGIDTTSIYGPYVAISNPKDESDAISFSGSYEDFEEGDWLYDPLTVLPPIGWVIRFKPKSVGIFEPDYKNYEVAINPNPANSYIQIPESESRVTVYDNAGKVFIDKILNDDKVNISALPDGLYFVKILFDNKSTNGRFIKS